MPRHYPTLSLEYMSLLESLGSQKKREYADKREKIDRRITKSD